MNKQTRKELSMLADRLEAVQCSVNDAIEQITVIKEEEEYKFDNLPEQFQTDEKSEVIEELEDVIDDLGDVDLDDVIERLRSI